MNFHILAALLLLHWLLARGRQKIRILRYNYLVKRLYLLDKTRCLCVLHAINKVDKQSGDFGYSLNSSHIDPPFPAKLIQNQNNTQDENTTGSTHLSQSASQ